MFARDLLLIDYETTGTVILHGHEPIQVGAVRLDRHTLEERASFVSYIRPLTPEYANPRSMEVNGIDLATLRDAPKARLVVHALEEAVFTDAEHPNLDRAVILCSWNSPFDRPFHEFLLNRAGYDIYRHGYQWLCAMSMAIAYADAKLQDVPTSSSLQSYCTTFGVPRPEPHDALADARAAAEVLRRLHNV